MRNRFKRPHRHQAPELDITAFMNLMVILVPFLLITAVFNQVNILEMNLPGTAEEQEQQQEEKPPEFLLEIVVRDQVLEVFDRPGSLLRRFPRGEEGFDLKALSQLLQKLKARFPDEQVAIISLEPEIRYDDLIQVMDTVRVVEFERDGRRVQAELFPEIALGDAEPQQKGKGK